MSSHDLHESDHHPHVLPLSMYYGVGGGLLFFTFLTVFTAKFMPEILFKLTNGVVDIEGTLVAVLIAMAIACMKAGLVCAFFMHLRYDMPLNRATFISGLFFLGLFFLFTLADTLTREKDPSLYGIDANTPAPFAHLSGRPVPKSLQPDGTYQYQKVHFIKAKDGYNAAGDPIDKDGNVKGHH